MIVTADLFPKLPSPKNVIKRMPVKSDFRGVFHNKPGKSVQTLLKSVQRYLYYIRSSL